MFSFDACLYKIDLIERSDTKAFYATGKIIRQKNKLQINYFPADLLLWWYKAKPLFSFCFIKSRVMNWRRKWKKQKSFHLACTLPLSVIRLDVKCNLTICRFLRDKIPNVENINFLHQKNSNCSRSRFQNVLKGAWNKRRIVIGQCNIPNLDCHPRECVACGFFYANFISRKQYLSQRKYRSEMLLFSLFQIVTRDNFRQKAKRNVPTQMVKGKVCHASHATPDRSQSDGVRGNLRSGAFFFLTSERKINVCIII